ncbi:hypothetical protein OG741_00615 [Streptomyces sp. NBC_01410]|uniref:hypothetical protein n=1 Tax=Streptomyces sp. NBC_01410 TaxID=2903856 RepID=UPI003253CFDB
MRENTKAMAAQANEELSYERCLGRDAVLLDLGEVQPPRKAPLSWTDSELAGRRQPASTALRHPPAVGMNVPDAWRTFASGGATVAAPDTASAEHTDLVTHNLRRNREGNCSGTGRLGRAGQRHRQGQGKQESVRASAPALTARVRSK